MAAVLLGLTLWLFLLLLAALQEPSRDGTLASFASDPVVHVRLLLMIPLLLLAERPIDLLLGRVFGQFLVERLVRESDLPRWEAAFARAERRRDSLAAQIVLAVLAAAAVLAVTLLTLRAHAFPAWIASPAGTRLTWPGLFYAVAGAPLLLFLMLLWAWRWAIVSALLASLARLDLRLLPTHPDRAGGLGFLGILAAAPAPVVFAISSGQGALLAREVLQGHAGVTSQPLLVATFVVLVLLVSTGPLFLFAPRLARLKLEAHVELGALGAQHSGAFEQKWFGLEHEQGSNLLGAPEVSSLADLSAVFQTIRGIRLVPLTLGPAATVTVAALLPMVPVLALEIPLVEVLKRLVVALV